VPVLPNLCLVALSLLVPPGQEGGDDNLLRVRALGDSTPSKVFYAIAEPASFAAFETLKLALDEVSDRSSTEAAYGATALFRRSAAEVQVVDWLSRRAFQAQEASHQIAATRALTYFWRRYENRLLRILRDHATRECRETALMPLLPELIARGDRPSCELVFENGSLLGSDRNVILGALRCFTSRPAELYLVRKLREPETGEKHKLLLLDVLDGREGRVVEAAIEQRLEDASDAVRLRALEILGRQQEGATMERLRAVARKGSPEFVVDAILVLAEQREGDPRWIEELYGFTLSQAPEVRRGAAHALGRLPTHDALTLLHRMMLDPDRQVQRIALERIGARRQHRSIPPLISGLSRSKGLLAAEIARTLRLLTGLDHGSSAQRWRSWFDAEAATFQLPTGEEAIALEQERQKRRNAAGEFRTATFYGLAIESERVCFVLDTSGSMADPAGGRFSRATEKTRTRLSVAKEELNRALRQLLDGVFFNIIVFSSDVSSFRPKLVQLGDRTRVEATEVIGSWTSAGATAIYDALRRALEDRSVEAIYLLTDGDPTAGAVQEPGEIRRRIGELTRLRKVKIHGIAIGRESQLLRWLAGDSGGQYVQIL